MDDLISRQAVLSLVESGYLISNGNYKKVKKMIEELPSAQRHGKWMYDKETRFDRCSACGLYGVAEMKFCPSCGAFMHDSEKDAR